ncbi:4'-phosphopantetheinyl transferase superfamily protein [Marinobacter sp. CHS3-4]|uniref:4'-phosphopantetheinyl transferase family protein n=1 Tax=Marinobacter sp. CHS3-4 TaxID=3045174 RepID=UPI0024B486AD|nr:4'-phosphopantetheinyl transferase superfamily protein [Marinobacter sp. CHS3-4]MDI9245584.1 4'-phosphopantetheinyl transferase superfamily protein [Marinobacter sp. CHS3-4]
MLPDVPEFPNIRPKTTTICVIWALGDAASEDLLRVVEKILDKPAIERSNRLFWKKDRVRFLCSHLLRRALLSRLTGVPMDEILFTTNRYGKPYLTLGGHEHSAGTWNFNVSSSADWVAFLATNNGQCGIDIERLPDTDPMPDLKEMSKANVFSGREKEYLMSGPGSFRLRFYQIWTLKEAYLKYTGRGLAGIEQIDMVDLFNLQQPMNEGQWASEKGDATAFHRFEEDYALSVVLKRDQAMPEVHVLHDEQVFELVKGTFPRKRKSDRYA